MSAKDDTVSHPALTKAWNMGRARALSYPISLAMSCEGLYIGCLVFASAERDPDFSVFEAYNL